ncbi:MAG: hypothetical protein NT075_01345 [Chloroflexi bacterium]|nr:hypothetical protein [Chloroflexota bacterium]
MKRICLIVSLMIVLFGSVLVLDTYHATFTVQAQADPNAQAAQRKTYLPFISLSVPTPTPPSRIKSKSGIHMGNRGKDTDWPLAAFALITGTAAGIWPAATVIQSAQLYNFVRDTASPCRIQSASIRLSNVYTYLTQALKNGTQLVIRITPSPGNFIDYLHPGITHTLLTGETAAGGNYCKPSQPGELSQDDKVHGYRDIGDIVHQEMDLIWHLNDSNRWPQAQIFFEPANEPNNEWYTQIFDKLKEKDPEAKLAPDVDNKAAWIDMDNYFANLYDLAKQVNSDLQVLTPPIGQENWAEHYKLHTCEIYAVFDTSNPVRDQSGYDFMPRTYGQGRFAGFSWHNYWIAGESHEQWGGDVVTTCRYDSKAKPPTDHVYQYFPEWMQSAIAPVNGKPTFITEADLYATCNKPEQPITSKILYPVATQISLQRFFAQEQGARYVIDWLLVQEDDGSYSCFIQDPQSGKDKKDGNYEIAWHEAFQDKLNTYYDWFRFWWLNDE